jgi:predicted nucleic acid-binding protein
VYFDTKAVLFPSIVVYEVHKKMAREQDGKLASAFLSQIHGFGDRLIPLDLDLAITAAETSLRTGLAITDAIIYGSAREYRAQLITSNGHFANLPRVTWP